MLGIITTTTVPITTMCEVDKELVLISYLFGSTGRQISTL